MVTKLSIALVEMDEMDKIGKIGKMAIKMGEVGTAGIPIGVRIATATTMLDGQHRRGRQCHAVEPAAHRVGDPHARGDDGDRQHRGLHGDGQAGDDVGGVADHDQADEACAGAVLPAHSF
jgi:hypothetical protein